MNKKSIYYSQFIFLLSLLPLLFFSCTKNSEKDTKNENLAADTSTASLFKEANEDLFTVDFSYFYDELSPHGEWIEVNAKDLGINIKPGSSINSGHRLNGLFSGLPGIKTAYAQTGEELFYLFVWRPSIELASKIISENDDEEYTPYNNGQWIYTEAGWYFKAGTPYEDLTCHYGRWTKDPNLGWVWLPGKVWSPAWVEWRVSEEHIAWAPVPPGIYIDIDVINVTQLNENRFTIVEKRHFIEPSVYKYRYQYVENKNKIMIKEMTKTEGVMIKNKTVINKGPDVSVIEKSAGKKIEQVKIKKVGKKEDGGYTNDAVNIYSPEFKKVSEVKKEPVSKPQKLVSYQDAKKITKDDKEDLKQKDKEIKKEGKEQKKERKEFEKEEKKEDKGIKKESKKDADKVKDNKDIKKNDGGVKQKDKQEKGKK